MSRCAFDKNRNCMDDCEWYLSDPLKFVIDGKEMMANTRCVFVGTQLTQSYLTQILVEQNLKICDTEESSDA